MTRNRIFLIIQSLLCVLGAIALIAADLSVYFSGLALKTDNPMLSIYTPEAIAARAVFVVPILAVSLIVTIVWLIMGVRDEKADRPVKMTVKKPGEGRALSGSALNIARLIVLVVGVVCLIVGIFNGSMLDVLIKASKICTECIGLG